MKPYIVNVSHLRAEPDLIAAGVFDLPEDLRAEVVALMRFAARPTWREAFSRSRDIAKIAASTGATTALVNVATCLHTPIWQCLIAQGIRPIAQFWEWEDVDGKRTRKFGGFVGYGQD